MMMMMRWAIRFLFPWPRSLAFFFLLRGGGVARPRAARGSGATFRPLRSSFRRDSMCGSPRREGGKGASPCDDGAFSTTAPFRRRRLSMTAPFRRRRLSMTAPFADGGALLSSSGLSASARAPTAPGGLSPSASLSLTHSPSSLHLLKQQQKTVLPFVNAQLGGGGGFGGGSGGG
jgi:hypothetical protein